MKVKLVALATVLTMSLAAHAAVTYDDNGVGFVGKGDVQNVFDWNNQTLQNSAGLLQFRMVVPSGGATWKCQGLNPQNNLVTQTKGSQTSAVNSDVSFDARKNRNGQITGFLLSGFDQGSSPDFASVGECIAPNSNWKSYYLVPDSIEYDNEGGEMLLQVSADGSSWYDLPITD